MGDGFGRQLSKKKVPRPDTALGAGAPARGARRRQVSCREALSMQESPFKGKTGVERLWNALGYSLQGMASAFRHEDAFRQECLLAAFLIPAALLIPVGGTERALMIASVLLVLIVELLNSAVEAAVDRISLENHLLAKRAKDIGSAAVFLSLSNAAAVWILIRTAVVVLLLAVLGFGTGLLFGAGWGWSFFSLGLVGLLVHHVRHLNLLRQWASRSLTEAVPEGSGAWEEVFTLLYRRQRAETARNRQLAQSLARSRQAGRALPYGVAILDAEYRIVWCNDSCEAHFGIDAEADVGQPITNLVRQPEFVGYVAAGEFSKPLQLKTTRDGLVLSVQFVPYVDSQRLLLSRDITQGTRLETMRRDFVANVSHELRTPLTVLVGFP